MIPGERIQPLHGFFAESHKRRRIFFFFSAPEAAHGFFQAGFKQLCTWTPPGHLHSPDPAFPTFPKLSSQHRLLPPFPHPQPKRRRQRTERNPRDFPGEGRIFQGNALTFPAEPGAAFASFPSLCPHYLQSSRSSRRAGNIIKLQ